MKLRERLTPYLLLGVLTLGTGLGIGLGISDSPSPSAGLVTDYLELTTTRILAGREIHGALVVENSGRTINLTKVATVKVRGKTKLSGCIPSVGVGLDDGNFSQGVGFALPCVGTPFLIPTGTTRIPITIVTSYMECGGQPVTPTNPRCVFSKGNLHFPPLPAGIYKTQVDWSATVPLPSPMTVNVTVVAAPRTTTTIGPITSTTSTAPTQEGSFDCQGANLHAQVTSGGGEASQPFSIIAVSNSGPTCLINGYPRIVSASGHEATPTQGKTQSMRIAVTDGPDYEHPDPGPHPVTLTTGGSASFALGTNTASGAISVITTLSITLPGSTVPLAVSNVNIGCSGTPIQIGVTAFVEGAAGPPTG